MSAQKYRKLFIAGRAPLSDDDYAARLNVDAPMSRWVILTRRALGRACGISPECIYPDDNPAYLVKMFVGWSPDEDTLSLALDEELGAFAAIELPQFFSYRCFWLKRPGPRTVGEWTLATAERLSNAALDQKGVTAHA